MRVRSSSLLLSSLSLFLSDQSDPQEARVFSTLKKEGGGEKKLKSVSNGSVFVFKKRKTALVLVLVLVETRLLFCRENNWYNTNRMTRLRLGSLASLRRLRIDKSFSIFFSVSLQNISIFVDLDLILLDLIYFFPFEFNPK